MKQFESITEKEILNAAYYNILDLYIKRCEENEAFKKEHGRDNSIAKHWVDKYDKQLNELHEAILKLEQAEQND